MTKRFYIPEYKETWALESQGKFPNGEYYYNFKIEGSEEKIEKFHRSSFDRLFIDNIIL